MEAEDKYRKTKEPQSVIAYEGILYNAFNKVILSRAEDPYNQYPLAVEALVLAVPTFGKIEENVKKFKKNEWEKIKRKIQLEEKDTRRQKTLIYDALFLFVKHELERNNLLLKFREVPRGGGFTTW